MFDNDPFYFDNDANREILLKVADKCYRPATAKILDLVKRHEGRFRVSYAISGVCLEQLEKWAPDVIDLFKALADTACEFIGETSHHSPSFLFDWNEFDLQVDAHRAKVRELFWQSLDGLPQHGADVPRRPRVAHRAARRPPGRAVRGRRSHPRPSKPELRLRAAAIRGPARGADGATGQAPAEELSPERRRGLPLRESRGEWPLTAEKFARWVNDINGDGYCCNLFMDYETLGEQVGGHGDLRVLDACRRGLRRQSRPERLLPPRCSIGTSRSGSTRSRN